MHELQGLAIDVRLLDENNNEVDITLDDDEQTKAPEHKEELVNDLELEDTNDIEEVNE